MAEDYQYDKDDPVLGKFIAEYPSNKLRLLIYAGIFLAVVWFVVTVALWQVEETIAATVTVVVLSAATLFAGWYITHLWNREVILYRKGFSYREGSNIASIKFTDVSSVQQRAERLSYFGGLLRRTVYKLTMTTVRDEHLVVDNRYHRIDDLSFQLEKRITAAQTEQAIAELNAGKRLEFAPSLALTEAGIVAEGRRLSWADYGGHRIEDRQLVLLTSDGTDWERVPLATLVNARLLLELIQRYTMKEVKS